jgi:hypothetical protein
MSNMQNITLKNPKAPFTTRGWTLESILARSPNFCAVPRCSAEDASSALNRNEQGVPMIIQDLHKSHLWSEVLTLDKFREYSPRSGEAYDSSS